VGLAVVSSSSGSAATGSSAASTGADEDEPKIILALDCAGLVAAGRFAEAIPVCSAEITTASDQQPDEMGWLNRGRAYEGEGQAGKALTDYDRVINAQTGGNEGNGLAMSRLGRARIFLRQGRFAEALMEAVEVKNFKGDNGKHVSEAQNLEATAKGLEKKLADVQTKITAGQWAEADTELERMQLKEGVDLSRQIYTLRAQCLTRLARYPDAIRMYQGRAQLELESSDTEYQVGRLQLALGNLEKGRKLVDACARSNPDHRAALALRKKLKAIMGVLVDVDKMLIKQAVEALETLLKETTGQGVDPGEFYYDEGLASVMLARPFEFPILRLLCAKNLRLKQADPAIERCQRVLDLSQSSSSVVSPTEQESAWLQLGEAYVLAERYDDALALLRKAQRHFPRSQRLHEALQRTSTSLKKSKQKDYYRILGVPKDASEQEIRRAYNKAARRWHPDKQRDEGSKAEAVSKMQDLNAALSVLTDKKKRAQVDAGMDPEDPQQGAGGGHHGGPFGGNPFGHGGHGGGGFAFNFEDLFRQQQQQQGRQRGGGSGHQRHHQQHQQRQQRRGGGGGSGFDDFFKFDL